MPRQSRDEQRLRLLRATSTWRSRTRSSTLCREVTPGGGGAGGGFGFGTGIGTGRGWGSPAFKGHSLVALLAAERDLLSHQPHQIAPPLDGLGLE